jgi:hypothetical protein
MALHSGTDEYAKYCRGFLWVELGCFIGETEDLKNYGKLLPSEWYTVDTGFDVNNPLTKKLFSEHVTKLKQQLSNDNALAQKRKWDYLLGLRLGKCLFFKFKNKFKKELEQKGVRITTHDRHCPSKDCGNRCTRSHSI